jgi:polyether ionophore transport system permease protein
VTTHAGPAASSGRTTISPWSRIYGFGTVYAKTLRDSRLAVLILCGLIAGMFLATGAAFGGAYATVESRAELATLVSQLPPVMAGIYGQPFPIAIETMPGSIAWKGGPSLALMAALWSVLALSSTLATESRRGSLEFVATTPLGMRRIAVEKLFAHLTGMLIVVLVLALTAIVTGLAFNTLPGDEITPAAAFGFAIWVGVMALASGSVAFALAPLVGRGAATAIAGAVLLGGYFINGYQAAVPAFAGLANATWWGWTARFHPLTGGGEWVGLIPAALVAIVLFVVGVEAFARRDLGVTARIPWPSMPVSLLGLRGPASRSFGERLPMAIAWGVGIGLFAFVLGGAASSFTETLKQQAPEALQVFKSLFPTIDLSGAGGFLELTFVTFGFILAGFAAATIVAGWASDEQSGRLEMLLSTPMSRFAWAARGGLGVFAAIGVMTLIVAAGVALGSSITGGDVVTPILGSAVIGLYALALAGIGLAFGGLVTTSFAGEVVAALVIVTFLIDFLVPALDLPDALRQLALTSHLGQPMIGVWDWVGMGASVAIAVGGLLLGAWGMSRRDVQR